jgi:hypothetical protein
MSGLEGLLAGKVLVNRYRIGEVIGRGGFAAVYRAGDERLGREVAVKVITLTAVEPDAQELLRERFQREARSVAALPQHPNVVTVYDFGRDPETGIDFLVMELLRGEDLATRLGREPRLPLELATCILRDAVEGVAVGHRAGLVHRDVKPGNVFLAESVGGEPFRVCVLDFGIARLVADEGTVSRLTQQGTTPLSPAYASPEQLRGEVDLTPASDVFSLGVVAYQLLAGERPFPPERRRGPDGWVAPPLAAKNPRVPREVAEAVHRALAFEPADRFPDAGAFASALDAATGSGTGGWPVVAAGDDSADRVERRAAGLGAAGAAGIGAGALAASAADHDDRTLLQSSPAAVPAATPVPDRVAPVTSAARPPLSSPPRRRSRAMPIVLFVALVIAGGAAMAAYVSRGGRAQARTAAGGDTAVSTSTTTTPAPSGTGSGTAPAAPGAPLDTQPSIPASAPAMSAPPPDTGTASPPSTPADGGMVLPAPPSIDSPSPVPSAPPAGSPSSPAPARPAPAQPTPPLAQPAQPAPAQPPPQQAPPPSPPQPAPHDTVHLGTPPPQPAPRDTLKLGPPPPPPAQTVPPPAPTTGTPPPDTVH